MVVKGTRATRELARHGKGAGNKNMLRRGGMTAAESAAVDMESQGSGLVVVFASVEPLCIVHLPGETDATT